MSEETTGSSGDERIIVTIGRQARICIAKEQGDTLCGRRNFGDPNWVCGSHGARTTVDQPDRVYRRPGVR